MEYIYGPTFCPIDHDYWNDLLQTCSVIAGMAAISVLLHASQIKNKYWAVFCHWLDGSMLDVSG